MDFGALEALRKEELEESSESEQEYSYSSENKKKSSLVLKSGKEKNSKSSNRKTHLIKNSQMDKLFIKKYKAAILLIFALATLFFLIRLFLTNLILKIVLFYLIKLTNLINSFENFGLLLNTLFSAAVLLLGIPLGNLVAASVASATNNFVLTAIQLSVLENLISIMLFLIGRKFLAEKIITFIKNLGEIKKIEFWIEKNQILSMVMLRILFFPLLFLNIIASTFQISNLSFIIVFGLGNCINSILVAWFGSTIYLTDSLQPEIAVSGTHLAFWVIFALNSLKIIFSTICCIASVKYLLCNLNKKNKIMSEAPINKEKDQNKMNESGVGLNLSNEISKNF